eukprot:CAMPEP_0196580764 /NCGR_PEP_ID=MMETSP1081-20130531/30496_1 /TAXON_ID=36882 /ORGANISM="Pyramimonas amylifera, Strain CCMP720" /LENGTH=282 /DNA_ID=CAMNT_0041900741 /DNA_START=28 /DNA_END=877 /DNA_ORIENTATION=-
MASRMESTGLPGNVQISEDMFQALQKSSMSFVTIPRGKMEIKGKGLQDTYLLKDWISRDNDTRLNLERLTVFNPPDFAKRRQSSLVLRKSVDSCGRQHSPSSYSDSDSYSPSPRSLLRSGSFLASKLFSSESPTGSTSLTPKALSRLSTSDTVLRNSIDARVGAQSKSRRKSLQESERNIFGIEENVPSPNTSFELGEVSRRRSMFVEERAVLLVDHMVSVLMQYRRVLQRTGLPVYTARDGVEALDLMKKKSFIVVFMEVKFPKGILEVNVQQGTGNGKEL